MESESEKLQLVIKGTLYKLTVEQLIKVCNVLQIAGPDEERVTGKKRGQLVTHIIKHLEKIESDNLEDEGMSELPNIQDTIDQIQDGTADQSEEQVILQKEVDALRLSLQEKENATWLKKMCRLL